MQIVNLQPGQKDKIIAKLNAVLVQDGRLKLLPAEAWLALDPLELRIWCHCQAIYALPTLELVHWLKDKLAWAGDAVLEIGSGNNDLGYHVGIRQTDSYLQAKDAAILAYYQAVGNAPTRPKPGVEELDALAAVTAYYHPKVVVGAWITQWGDPSTPDSSLFGVDETKLIQQATYIFIGHDRVHRKKRILNRPHYEERPPWLLSRLTDDQAGNFIAIWQKQ